MKKIYLIILFPFILKAQYNTFFRGFGAFASATESTHFYTNKDQDKRQYNLADLAANPTYYYPRNYIGHEYFNVVSGGIFAEFGKGDRWRWQTEAEWIKKGTKSRELTDPFFGTMGGYSTSKYKYIEWNNHLKFYNPAGYLAHWYVMVGVRLEYLFSSSVGAYAPYDGNFATIWFNPNAAAGYEYGLTKNWYLVTEYHYNPDLLSHRFGNIRVRNRTYEFRVGILYRPKQKRIDDCNAPRYKGPAY